MFGPDQDNYVKVVAAATSGGGLTLQFTDEQSTGSGIVHTVNTTQAVSGLAQRGTVELRLTGNPSNGTVNASYRLNGAGNFVALPGTLILSGTARTAFFSTNGRAGIIAFAKNNLAPVTVSYDRFEIAAAGSTPALGNTPQVTTVNPFNGATGVVLNTPVTADLFLPNGGLSDSSVKAAGNVKLYRTSDGAAVAGTANTTGGGDAIIFQPSSPLQANTKYTFEVTSNVKDVTGASVAPFTSSFTTGTSSGTSGGGVSFTKVSQSAATGHDFTGVTVGPDGKVYAGTQDGYIIRYTPDANGNLTSPQTISTVRSNNGGAARLITGITFDPSSTASNLILWVDHGQGTTINATDFTGKISRLSGANLGTYQDYVTNLPRSVRDHLTNQSDFGPDGALYLSQGSNSSFGARTRSGGTAASTC